MTYSSMPGFQLGAVTSYPYEQQIFIAGQVSDFSYAQIDTASCDEPIEFGLVLSFTNKSGILALPSSDNLQFAGAARHEHLDPVISGNIPRFPAKYPIPMLRVGRIALQIDDDVTTVSPLDPVNVRITRNGEKKRPGQIRKDTTDAVVWENARFTGRIIPGKLAEVSILKV